MTKEIFRLNYILGSSQTSASNLSTDDDGNLVRLSSNFSDDLPNYYRPKQQKLDIVNEDVALVLDRTKTISRSATLILGAVATRLGQNIDDLNFSHSKIHKCRIKIRKDVAERLKTNIQAAAHLTIHWDGKLLPGSDKTNKIERVPVIVSGVDTEQLLGVPQFSKGSAVNEALGIAEKIFDWKISLS